jgi:hypothetical protein
VKHIDFVLVGDGPLPKDSCVKLAIKSFLENGSSYHSPQCLLGRYIIKHCVETGLEFTLTHHALYGRTAGWTIRRETKNEGLRRHRKNG